MFFVADYFMNLDQILTDIQLKFKPEQTFDMNEKGCRLALHFGQSMSAKR
jgi:hypothetical protein